MIILGVNDGHNSSACLLINGELKCAIAEERLSREKNHFGYPKKAIEFILNYCNISKNDIDRIAMTSKHFIPAYYYVKRNSKLSIQDYWKEQTDYWYPKLIENKDPNYLEVMSHLVDKEGFPYDNRYIKNESDAVGMWNARVSYISKELNIDSEKIIHHDHHKCHGFYGFISENKFDSPSLIYTMDGFGDGANGTVSIYEPGKKIVEISRSSNCNIGRMYRYATLLLGMRPAEHEYKLMGLAAYNSHKYGKTAYDVYAETLKVDGLKFKYDKKIKDHFFYFKDKLQGQRFDAIAYGIQKRCEEILTEWVSNGISETGVKNIIMSGGVAQNIKANKLISEIKDLESLHIPPGPGDESLSIGAAYLEYFSGNNQNYNKTFIKNGYLGPSFSESYINKYIKDLPANLKTSKMKNDYVAKLIASGDVIARFSSDNMEFGARALGNRSIIADPRNSDVIHHINKLVKMRDFWMPFAPSILSEREEDYIVNPKKLKSKYMAIGFDSTELAKSHIPAGLHPFDKTARPQIVYKEDNPKYHSLIKSFENLTGVGALMNTSFNIHGEPIVGTPEHAIDTFLRSGIHHLILGDWLISKKD